MRLAEVIAGFVLLFIVLLDAFEAIVLPRRVTRRFRLTRLFYRTTWIPWRAVGTRFKSTKIREAFFSFYGPLSLLLLLVVWAIGLIAGFALLILAAGPPDHPYAHDFTWATTIYISGTNFFTLGLDEVAPRTTLARILTVFEAGMGFGFLAIVIGYLPTIFTGFSKREVSVVLLDAHAGSPPTAAELLRRHAHPGGLESLHTILLEWERWSAELLESHLSYPVLCYFRSQHDNESWLSALTAICDACAFTIVSFDGPTAIQAQSTLAMTRHAVVDLAQVFHLKPAPPKKDRLPATDLYRIRKSLKYAGWTPRQGPGEDQKLNDLRQMYEPSANALAEFLCMELPPWIHPPEITAKWRASVWGRISGALPDDVLDESPNQVNQAAASPEICE
jgi:hypothetical protein